MVLELWQFNIMVTLWVFALLTGMVSACFWICRYIEKKRNDSLTRKVTKNGWVWLGIYAWFLTVIAISYLFFIWIPIGLWNLIPIIFFSFAIVFLIFLMVKKNSWGAREWAISFVIIALVFFFFYVETTFVLSSPYTGTIIKNF